jgi:hypothetical protein
MRVFGKVEVILNENAVLISSSEDLAPNEVVNVFSLIESPELKEKGFEKPLIYPKGELVILAQQENKMYLAETFRDTVMKTKTVSVPPKYQWSVFSDYLSQFYPQKKEITLEVPGPNSAELNKEQSLNVSISKVVSVGDLIGKL